MPKITFIGAGSTVFAKNLLGDCMFVPALEGAEYALYDIDERRLRDSEKMLNNLKENYNVDAKIVAYSDRKAALKGAK